MGFTKAFFVFDQQNSHLQGTLLEGSRQTGVDASNSMALKLSLLVFCGPANQLIKWRPEWPPTIHAIFIFE